MNNNLKENVVIEKMYNKPAILKVEDFLDEFNYKVSGLTSNEVLEKQNKYGKNELKQTKKKKWYNYLLSSFFSPFNSILLGIIGVLIYTDVMLSHNPSYANIVVITILILASTILDFFEEYKSNKAAEKLKEMVETQTTVIRDNIEMKIPTVDIVVGDVLVLSAGSMIGADCRIIESKELYISQSTLTGESTSVKKNVNTENAEIADIVDLDTICFMGTNVVSGYAKAIVIRTGNNTYFGKISSSISMR